MTLVITKKLNLLDVLNYALVSAIHNNDVFMTKQCFLEGAILTQDLLSDYFPTYMDIYSQFYRREAYYANTELFDILLKYGANAIMNNLMFIIRCPSNPYYVTSIIRAGYGTHHPSSSNLFAQAIARDMQMKNLQILLDNGFDKYIQPNLMNCIKHERYAMLALFQTYGANFYRILHDIENLILSETPNHNKLFAIQFVMMKMDIVSEPVIKYFLIKLTVLHLVIPIEIFVYIFKLYIEIDNRSINRIYHVLDPMRHRMLDLTDEID